MKGKSNQARDDLLERFAVGFQRQAGHRPTFNRKQLALWSELRQQHPATLLKAKIDAWWDHRLPKTFEGHRTFGAFLQWFDDIVVPSSSTLSKQHPSDEQMREALHEGSAPGKRLFHELVGDLAPDAQVRTLVTDRYAKDDADAKQIIKACT